MAVCISHDNSMMASIHHHHQKKKVFLYDLENKIIQDEFRIIGKEKFHIDISCNNQYLVITNNDKFIAYKKLVNKKITTIQTETHRNTHIYFSNGDQSIIYVNDNQEIVFQSRDGTDQKSI